MSLGRHALLAVWLLASSAIAAPAHRVGVLVIPLDAKAGSQQGLLEHAAEASLATAGRFDLVPTQDLWNPARASRRTAIVKAARERLSTGKRALDDLDNVKAIELFASALDALKSSDWSRDYGLVLEAWVAKAAGHAVGGEISAAKKELEALVAIAPKVELNSSFFTPELMKFAEGQRRSANAAKGELLVRTEPAGARVWVDGLYRGVSPVLVTDLSTSKHAVAAVAGGHAVAQELSALGETLLALPPSELADPWTKALTSVRRGPETESRDRAAQEVGRQAKVDELLLVLARGSLGADRLELTALRLEVSDGHNLGYHSASVLAGDAQSLERFFEVVTRVDAPRDGRAPVHHYPAPRNDGAQVAGTTLLGVGVVGLATGVVFGVLALTQANTYRVTPQTRAIDSAYLASSGRTYSVIADVSYLVGLVSGLVGGGLWLFAGLPGPAREPPRPKNRQPETAL